MFSGNLQRPPRAAPAATGNAVRQPGGSVTAPRALTAAQSHD
jgi:hypothetical protein